MPNQQLLTEEEQRQVVAISLGSRFIHHGELFYPNNVFYQASLDEDSLQAMYGELCEWLGVPRTISSIRFAANINNSGKNNHRLVLKDSLRTKSQVCAAILCRHLARLCLERRQKLPTNPFQAAALIDLFTLEYGLSLVLINGFAQAKRFRHGQGSRFTGYELANKNFLAPRAYTRRFIEFTHHYHLDIASWGGYLTPKARHIFPKVLAHTAGKAPKRLLEVIKLDKQARLRKYKIAALIILSAVLIGVSIFVTSNRPKYLPAELSIQREKIDQLRSLYQLCVNEVEKEQSNTDQNNYFISRNTEADSNRCISLRNKYNYEVDSYNQTLKQLY